MQITSTKLVTSGGVQKLQFQFNQSVGGSLSLTDVDVFNGTSGKIVAKYTYDLSYDKSTNVATLTFKVKLPAGQWKAQVWSGGVANADWTQRLDGDANGTSGGHYAHTFTI